MTEITKAEMMAMLEVQKESAKQMERVASNLALITESQNKIAERLEDVKENCATNLCDVVVQKLADKFALALVPCKEKNDSIKAETAIIAKDIKEVKKNTFWLRIIVGGATLVIVIAAVVLKLIVPQQEPHVDIDELVKVLHGEHTHNELPITTGTGRTN